MATSEEASISCEISFRRISRADPALVQRLIGWYQ